MVKAEMTLDLGPVKFLRGSLANKAMRIALNKASVPVKAGVVQEVPKLRAFLSKSIRIKTKFYKNKQVWASIVGPGSKYKRKGKKITRGPRKGVRPDIFPAKYAPLIEKGTKKMQARRPLRTALARTRNQFQTIMKQKLAEEIAKTLPKV